MTVDPDCHASTTIAAAEPGARASDSYFAGLFEVFTPRRQCMNFEADVVWLHLVSDLLIAASYFSIPIALMYFVKRRHDLAFNWMFMLFAVFIMACGTTHLFGVWALWQPMYRIDGIVKLLTGVVSGATAVLLWKLIPVALALPSPAQLRHANEELKRENNERNRAEQAQRELAEQLEQRVEARTQELARTNQVLRDEIEARERAEEDRNRLFESERHARGEAERLNRVKDEFLTTLSHELRTPLNAVLGWSQILRSTSSSNEDLEKGLETIDRNSRTLTQMIEDLLDLNRIAAGRLRLDVQPVDLVAAIESAIETVRPAALAKDIRLRSVLDSKGNRVLGDSNRLQQIVWNLLSNAIKFTDKGGRVEVQLQRVNSHFELTIADTGSGIPAEFMPELFSRFRQADAAITRRHGGLGIGLSIVRHLVELHGGSVRAHSAGKDHGATFVVTLPISVVRTELASAHPSASRETEPASLSGLRVLVVDDDPDAREILKHILGAAGAQVVAVGSVAEALQAFDDVRPDLLIGDIGMPEQDGYDLIRLVRARGKERGGNVIAIALTALARAEDRMRALRAGFQTHVPKPVEPAELIAVIGSLLGRM